MLLQRRRDDTEQANAASGQQVRKCPGLSARFGSVFCDRTRKFADVGNPEALQPAQEEGPGTPVSLTLVSDRPACLSREGRVGGKERAGVMT